MLWPVYVLDMASVPTENFWKKMELCVQPWNVSTMAQAAGIQALEETEYVEKDGSLFFRKHSG